MREKDKVIKQFLKKYGEKLSKYENIINSSNQIKQIISLTDPVFLINVLNDIDKFEVVIYGYKVKINENENIDIDCYYLLELKNVIDIYLCYVAGFIDDLLIEMYLDSMEVIDFICRRLKINHDVSLDNYLQECLPLYEGPELLSVSMVRWIRDFKAGKKINKKGKINQDSLIEEETLEESKKLNSYDELRKNIISYDGNCPNDEFVYFFRTLNVESCLDFSNLDEYKKYILLRFGFVDSKYLDINQIAEVLNLDKTILIQYEKKTIYLVRECLSYQFDSYIKLVKSFV